MKYILFLGFISNIYRKKPTVRIRLNDNLLDEFDLDDNKINVTKYGDLRFRGDSLLPGSNYLRSKAQLRFYNINLENDNEVCIKIDVRNDDNNYSNGFMTKLTTIFLEYIFLVPEKYFTNFNYYWKKYKLRVRRRVQNRISFTSFYKATKKNVNKLFGNYLNHVLWSSKNLNLDSVFPWYTLGNSGFYQINLKKKFGTFIPKNFPIGKCPMVSMSDMKIFFDKYVEYENK